MFRILTLCPGATETGFFDVAGKATSVEIRRTSEQAVATGLLALERGRSVVVDGRANALVAFATRLLPRELVARIPRQSVYPRQKQIEKTTAVAG